MRLQILKDIFKTHIRSDRELAFKICMVNKGKGGQPVSFRTLSTWLMKDSDKLTTATTQKVIREHLALEDSEILTEEKEVAAELCL